MNSVFAFALDAVFQQRGRREVQTEGSAGADHVRDDRGVPCSPPDHRGRARRLPHAHTTPGCTLCGGAP